MKSWLQDNDIEMYSTYNEGVSVAVERFIRILMNKIDSYVYLHMSSKNVDIDKLDNIINRYNDTYLSTIKMNSVDVKSSTYADFNVKNNETNPKFEVGDHVRT